MTLSTWSRGSIAATPAAGPTEAASSTIQSEPAQRALFDQSKSIYLEFYRGLAALGVAIAHFAAADGSLIGEFLAVVFVEMFFPLSGFILAPQVLRVHKHRGSLPIFLIRRWMRTIPLYLLGLFAIGAMTYNLYSPEMKQYLFFYHFLSSGYQTNDFYPVSWSLAAEEYYYVIFPLVILFLPISNLVKKTLLFLAVGLAIKIVAGMFYPQAFVRIATFTRVDSIGIGFLCYLLMERFKLWHALILSVIFLVSAVVHNAIHNSASVIAFIYSANICFGVICAMLYRHERNKPCANALFRGVATFIGSSSYSIYVFHLMVLTVAVLAKIPLMAYVAIVLMLSHAVHIYFELPLMRLRPKYRESARRAA